MSALKAIGVHVVLLGVATASAVAVWTKDEKAAVVDESQFEVWRGAPDKVEKIVLESPKRVVTAEARKDKFGRYFVVALDKEITPPSQPPKRLPDGGLEKVEPSKEPAKREKKSFIAVKAANELAQSLAPLMGLRSVGKIEDSRAEEFGFHEAQGTVKVWIAGKEHSMTLGGATPGGADRYVKDGAGHVFVVAGTIARDLETAETRLVERNLHEFADEDITRVKLTVKDVVRELVRGGTGKPKHWANPGSADQQDETAGNFMSKIDRLRVTDYIEGSEGDKAGDDLVVRVEYFGETGPLGFLEVVTVPGGAAAAPTPDDEGGSSTGKDDYIARTEYTRWFAKVTASVGEQIAQDVGSVVK